MVGSTQAKRACQNGKRAVSGNFETAENGRVSSVLRTQCRQGTQRLWKGLHRDDAEPVRVLARIAGVVPSRDEEGVHMRLARADRFLLDPADRADGAVGEDLAGRRDPVAVTTSRPSSSITSSANARPADGPPTLPASIRTLNGRWMSSAGSRNTPTTGAARPRVGSDRLDRHRRASCVPRRTVNATTSPTSCFAIAVEDAARRRGPELPSTATITSSGSSFPTAGCPASTAATSAPVERRTTFLPAARSATAAAISCERCMSCRSMRWRCCSPTPGGLTASAG